MSSRSLRNIDNATLNREAYSNNLTQLKIGNLGEFNSIQNQVNMLYSSIDLSGGGEGPVQDVINDINDISTELYALQVSQNATKATILEVQQNIVDINGMYEQVVDANIDNIYLDSSSAIINADKSFQNGIAFSKLNIAGFVRNGTDGSLYSAGLLGNVDFSPSANIQQSKLATITTAGKVANQALSASYLATPNTIAQRDTSGNVYVGEHPTGTNNYKAASCGFVISELNRVVDNATSTLDTLDELAYALGNDPNFFESVNATLASKASIIDASFSGNCRVAANIVVTSFNVSGIIRNDVNGNLYSSQLVANDLSGLLFYDSNLQTITETGKVANSATSATYDSTPNTIVLRDSSGTLFGNNVVGTMYSAIKDKDLSWNTWGYYPLSKTRAPVAPYAQSAWRVGVYNKTTSTTVSAATMCWSPELKILVNVITSPRTIFSYTYTYDLYNWTSVDVNTIHTYNDIVWSREQGLFVAVGTDVIYSNTGTSWSKNGVYLPSTNTWSSVCWSAELGMFVAVASSGGTNNRAMRSFDGKTWEIATTPNSNSWVSVCWAAELGIFVAVSNTSGTAYAMWSSNGLNWELAQVMPSTSGCNDVVWSPDLGIFYAATNGTSSLLSSDGKIWKEYATTGIAQRNFKCMWSREYKMFFGCGALRVVHSFNGINWSEVNYDNAEVGDQMGYIPECGFIFLNANNSQRMVFANVAFPSTYSLFDGPYAYTSENGTQYFNQLNFAGTQTFTSPLKSMGLSFTNVSSTANIQCDGNARFIFPSNSPQFSRVFTCLNTNSTVNSGWTSPLGTRINATISTDANSNWTSTESGTAKRIAQITLPFGLWLVYYRISLQPTSGVNTVATRLIAGISTSSQSTTFVSGSGSRYKDDFQRSLSASRNTAYIPRTCRITSSSLAGTTYYLNAELTYSADTPPSSIRADFESYMYAIKIQ